ncbi:hypothetical protein ColLi_04028 [Colletotrichum liriopes]|uniref:Uncharacterized protein n=1 Tax=Colletotrichum liriopes TaxID=708192 RepID=A0AA37LQ72_9PEZI|nr:hypothetical protein ColLi_04028 [Colletotrichum liriopes]
MANIASTKPQLSGFSAPAGRHYRHTTPSSNCADSNTIANEPAKPAGRKGDDDDDDDDGVCSDQASWSGVPRGPAPSNGIHSRALR